MKTRIFQFILAILAGVWSSNVSAEFWSGAELIQYLEEDMRGGASYNVGVASGYIMGVADTLGGALVCMPGTVTLKQTKQVVFNFMKSHPESWNQSADAVVLSALRETWPCAKK